MLVSVNTGHAAATQCVDAALQELVAEVLECAAYYSVAAAGAENTPGAEAATKAMTDATRDMIYLGKRVGSELNISAEATKARLQLHAQEMTKLVAGNSANWPILILRYKDRCDALHSDATPRYQALLKQECP